MMESMLLTMMPYCAYQVFSVRVREAYENYLLLHQKSYIYYPRLKISELDDELCLPLFRFTYQEMIHLLIKFENLVSILTEERFRWNSIDDLAVFLRPCHIHIAMHQWNLNLTVQQLRWAQCSA
jgi:hypothetical protein